MKESLSAFRSQSQSRSQSLSRSRSASLKESLSAFYSQSKSQSRSVSQVVQSAADYVVTNAGTAAANGDYTENGTFNGVPCYEKSSGASWLYYSVAGELETGKVWAIYSEKLNGTFWYGDQTDGLTPTIGEYTEIGDGDAPNAIVAAG